MTAATSGSRGQRLFSFTGEPPVIIVERGKTFLALKDSVKDCMSKTIGQAEVAPKNQPESAHCGLFMLRNVTNATR
jgi:hypothetical protein